MSSTQSPAGPSRSVYITLGIIVLISGFCALAYQVVWLREFRLIFGGAAPAASAVLAVFMGGLGAGGAMLGKWVERSTNPGRFYAFLEGGITITALITPLLMALVRHLYIQTGGIQTLGLTTATLLQILMTAVVLGPTCFLMGGTLPAMLKIVQSDADTHRVTTAVFYGLNVCGAVVGAFLASFVMLPSGGNLLTLFTAGFANGCIALVAYITLRQDVRLQPAPVTTDAVVAALPAERSGIAPAWFISAAAFTSGFVFFLIELVWYRASIPLFGGSVYNFGIILAMALAGIGAGSLYFSFFLKRFQPTLGAFSAVSGLLALCIILPFVLGDHLAYFALLLNSFFRPRSFEGLVFGWSLVCFILVFLPAFFSGIQFPFMISLLGRGGDDIGLQVGRTYAWNTFGAVSGALLGGFVLIPKLSITGAWRLAALAAILLSISSLILRFSNRDRATRGGLCSAALAATTCLLVLQAALTAAGPSAYWLHHPIGYGRANPLFGRSQLEWTNYVRMVNRSIVEAKDGRETSVAVNCADEYGMLSNGKSDGSALGDGPTVAMLGLVGAALHHGEVRDVCVVGLGTGITVGWLNQIESVKQVDVIELEQAVIDLAKYFKGVNFDALAAPKTHIVEGDAREVLVTRPKTYDLIVSEPSNIHRAGVANLYTREFYTSVAARMNPDAVFCQWVQSYETDIGSIQLVVSTLRSVFPKVELWQTLGSDLLLVCSLDPKPWDIDLVAPRLRTEPFKTATRNLWGTTTIEGFFARAVGNADFSNRLATEAPGINTDDMNYLEFSFGRRLGGNQTPVISELARRANESAELIPQFTSRNTPFDINQWASEFLWKSVVFRTQHLLPAPPPGQKVWPETVMLQFAFLDAEPGRTPADKMKLWPMPVQTEASRLYRAYQMAASNHPELSKEIALLQESWPVESVIFLALQKETAGDTAAAIDLYFKAMKMAQTHSLVRPIFVHPAWKKLKNLVAKSLPKSTDLLTRYFEIAATPHAYSAVSDTQLQLMMLLSTDLPLEYKVRAAEAWGKTPPWDESILGFREKIFREASHPDLAQAKADLAFYLRQTGQQTGDAIPNEPEKP